METLVYAVGDFFALGTLNLRGAYGFSEDSRVKFKVFGALLLCMLLMLTQMWALIPYARGGMEVTSCFNYKRSWPSLARTPTVLDIARFLCNRGHFH